jgi:GH25 family lysozyme M1 (1,4-beta-N-acetylmuramidase)
MPLVSWSHWTFWQFTDGHFGASVAVPGISRPPDANVFNGNKKALVDFIRESRTSL